MATPLPDCFYDWAENSLSHAIKRMKKHGLRWITKFNKYCKKR